MTGGQAGGGGHESHPDYLMDVGDFQTFRSFESKEGSLQGSRPTKTYNPRLDLIFFTDASAHLAERDAVSSILCSVGVLLTLSYMHRTNFGESVRNL